MEPTKNKALAKLGVDGDLKESQIPAKTEVPEIEQLTDRLQRYDLYGLPSLAAKYEYSRVRKRNLEELLYLECSWRQIADQSREISKTDVMIQEAIWEIFITERSYILKLHSAVHVYIACILNLQEYNLLREINVLQLFGNIRNIYFIHLDLWIDAYLPILQRVRQNKSLISPDWVIEMFDGMENKIVLAYLTYLCSVSNSINYARTLLDSSTCVAAFAKWAEHKNPLKPDGDKCRGNDNNALDSILSGPHQRITRYGLLLDPLCRKSSENGVTAKLKKIKKSADSLCRWINGRVSLDHLYKELCGVELDDLKAFSDLASEQISNMLDIRKAFDVHSPMPGVINATPRAVFHQDASIHLKFCKHSETKVAKVKVIVVTDALLICKAKKNAKSTLIRPPIRTDRITPVTQEGKELCLIQTNDFQCPVATFTLCFDDAKHQTTFLNFFIEARTRYQRLQQGTWKTDEYVDRLDKVVAGYHNMEQDPNEYQVETCRSKSSFNVLQIAEATQKVPLDDGGIWIG